MIHRLLSCWGFARPTAKTQRERDLEEARLALLEIAKLAEYYIAMQAMLQQRLIRLESEVYNA